MNLDPFLVLDGLLVYFAHIAVNFAFVMLCLCALVICALTYWTRRVRPTHPDDEAEDVGLSGFRWDEDDEP
ncbi:hypothetical protein [Streptomyces sp. CB03238]|uniref:hypothetical protein n=1 Tax=Streptomyces sp. CB03238 TaxID=1907777 RepID=UPI000A10EA05|nr:hypothetical protein [Streptomyces sp. CB03238]ORT59742.1 hypothetical protein BKD26_12690 [Streptomyces sp. CB03238]